MKNKKVVITGCNIISSLGLNLKENWDNLINGKSGIKRITLFDPSDLQTQIAGQVPDEFNLYAEEKVRKRTLAQMNRATRLGYIAVIDTIENFINNLDALDKSRCAVIFGLMHTGKLIEDSRNSIVRNMNNALPAWIALKYKFEGPSYSISTACSSSAYAIAAAYELIKNNQADLVVTGGADSTINPEEIKGFNEIYALSTNNEDPEKASRPFSINRDGFVIGEGAGVLILESEESAKKRDAKIFAEMVGYSLTTECYNIIAPKENGEGMIKTMETALKNANISIEEINYINAHGTSTVLNDKFETIAIKTVFKERAYKIPISSTKSMLGHTIAAAGAIEAIVTILSIKEGIIHPTINYQKDPELDLDYVPHKARKVNINAALSNSFAFGGHNATLIFKKYE